MARAAVSIDNARRHTREHTLSVTLQRSLLPRALPGQSALDVAYRHLPAHAAQGGVGGDWFDVIPLPGARGAGRRGHRGTRTARGGHDGRLRTAVHNFSTLDLPPDELLGHLDELVARIDQDEGDGRSAPVTGATCLYAVYDPSCGLCILSRAGHLEPALVHPDGDVEFPTVPGGPPMGLGGACPSRRPSCGCPRAAAWCCTRTGWSSTGGRDIDEGFELLRRALAAAPPTHGRTPEETCKAVLEALLPERPRDDVALVVARPRMLAADGIAAWDVPDDPAAVARVRAAATRTLDDRG